MHAYDQTYMYTYMHLNMDQMSKKGEVFGCLKINSHQILG